MEIAQPDPNCNLTEEESPKLLLPPDSHDITDIFGYPQLSPRVGEKYQVEIPLMVTGSEHLRLLMDPLDSEGLPDLTHSFLLGLPIPITWTHEQDIDFESEVSKVDKSVKSRKSRKGQNSKRKKSQELRAEQSDAMVVDEKESNAENLECQMESKVILSRPCEGKRSHLVPGSSGDSWSDTKVDGFVLGLYIFGKDFRLIKRFIENKEMSEILSFYYGAFYRSDRYRRWSDGQKKRSRRKIYGRKIFIGWRQQELLSRLLAHIPDELQNNLHEVSKSFVEGRTSLENYVFDLKNTVGICALVEAVGINKGKEDLTGLAMEPPRTTQVSPEIPSGKDFSSLTSGDIIRFLTGGFRLSKARCNDIFWEAVWPRLLARGWHSEQPKNQCAVSSNHYLVFLVPGVKKFSRRKLVKGTHYFDSVSNVLSKISSEPTLIELDAEGNGIGSYNEENGCNPGDSSDQDDPPSHKPCYLKPRISTFSSNHMKFTIVDSSLVHGGKASKMRELRCSPIDLMFTSKSVQKDTSDSRQVNANHKLSKGNQCTISNARHSEGKITNSTASCIKYTIVDTSLLHGGKSSRLRELRYLPVKLETSSEVSILGGNEDHSSSDSSGMHEQKIAGRLSSHGSVSSDTKPNRQPVTAGSLLKGGKNSGDGKYDKDSSNQNSDNSCIAGQDLLVHQDEKTNTSEDSRSKRTIKHHFSRRAKSSRDVSLVPPAERLKLTASVNTEASLLTEKPAAVSTDLPSPMKRQRLTACVKTDSDLPSPMKRHRLTACVKTDSDLPSPMKRHRFTASIKTDRSHLTENTAGNPIRLVFSLKGQKLNACAKTEQSDLAEKFSADISEQTGPCTNSVLDTSHFQDKVLSIRSLAKSSPESLQTHLGSSEKLPSLSSVGSCPPLIPLDARNGEPRMVEADGSQFNTVNNDAGLLTTANHAFAQEQQPMVIAQRQSKRSRSSTTRALEALESGLFDMRRSQKVKDVQTQAIQFSSPSRKARSRVKASSKHKSAGAKTEGAKQGKDTGGAFICSKDIINKPPQADR